MKTLWRFYVVFCRVKYDGPSNVHEGQPWEIQCSELKEDDSIRWTRNGQTLEPELSSGQLAVSTQKEDGISTLRARQATESHEGNYKCTNSVDAFHLSLFFDIKIRVLSLPEDLPLVLECANRSASDKVHWLKEKVLSPTALNSNEDVVRIDSETGSLEILKEKEEVYGNYTCKVANATIEYRVVPSPIAHLTDSVSVTEGETLNITCGIKPTPGVKVSWSFGDRNYTHSDGRVKIYGTVLIVKDISMEDRGDIVCRLSYNWSDPVLEHSSEAKTFLRVKDKLAALWPFLGICAEVVILCAIILIYEKKRNKAELEESDTDQSPDTKPTPNKESDVRQRK